jgi:integrase
MPHEFTETGVRLREEVHAFMRYAQRFKIVRDLIGLNWIRLHDLRHFTATQLMAAGVPVRTV